MKTDFKKPCNDCPFRKNAKAGWLADYNPYDLRTIVESGLPFPCHETIDADVDDVSFDDPRLEDMQACAGAALYLNNRLCLSRDRSMAALQQKLKAEHNAPNLHANVFPTAEAFEAYHMASPVRSWE